MLTVTPVRMRWWTPEKGGEGLWAGSKMGVVTGFQALGNARVTWVGGVKVFSDEFALKEVKK